MGRNWFATEWWAKCSGMEIAGSEPKGGVVFFNLGAVLAVFRIVLRTSNLQRVNSDLRAMPRLGGLTYR
jgi:hypothetical protein